MADEGRAGTGRVAPGDGAIAFVCAMPMELAPLSRRLGLARGPDDERLSRGMLRGRPVVATVTGMGTRLAEAGTRHVLAAAEVDHVVVVGITGALEQETPIGTVIRPELVVHGGSGASHRPVHLGPGEGHGTMWTSDRLTTEPDELARLRRAGVVSLDMETAAVAAVCEDHGVPWSVVRAISDRASDGSVDDEVFGLSRRDGTPDWTAVLRFMATRPHRVPGLAVVGRNARRAAVIAAEAAIRDCAA